MFYRNLCAHRNPVMTSEYVDELEKVGYTEPIDFVSLHDCGYFYIHRSCAMWAIGVTRDPSGTLGNVAASISTSLSRKCSYCNRYGASMVCKVNNMGCIESIRDFVNYFFFVNGFLSDVLSEKFSFAMHNSVRWFSDHTKFYRILQGAFRTSAISL